MIAVMASTVVLEFILLKMVILFVDNLVAIAIYMAGEIGIDLL